MAALSSPRSSTCLKKVRNKLAWLFIDSHVTAYSAVDALREQPLLLLVAVRLLLLPVVVLLVVVADKREFAVQAELELLVVADARVERGRDEAFGVGGERGDEVAEDRVGVRAGGQECREVVGI